MQTHWFYTVWPFLGGGGAIVMVAIMLLTDTFRSNIAVSRWRDAVWLAWLAAPLYWIHQLEEYSLPLLGFDYNLPDMVAKNIGFPPYPECPVPMVFYPVVNIALMWFGAPLAAYLCKRNLVLGFSYWGLIFANGLVHTMGGVTQHIYNPGLLTGSILFIPLSLWVIYALVFSGPYSGKVVTVSFVCGAVTHALLFMGYGALKAGVISPTVLVAYAVLIGFTPLILAALASRFFRPELLRPVRVLPTPTPNQAMERTADRSAPTF